MCIRDRERSPEGWREIEPEGFFVDVDCFSQKLIYQKDEIFPGHILNAKTFVDENFSEQTMIDKQVKIFEELIAQKDLK